MRARRWSVLVASVSLLALAAIPLVATAQRLPAGAASASEGRAKVLPLPIPLPGSHAAPSPAASRTQAAILGDLLEGSAAGRYTVESVPSRLRADPSGAPSMESEAASTRDVVAHIFRDAEGKVAATVAAAPESHEVLAILPGDGRGCAVLAPAEGGTLTVDVAPDGRITMSAAPSRE